MTAPVVAQVTQGTLPFTGMPAISVAAVSASLAALGLLLLALSRASSEQTSGRSWD
ncbi:MAG TPA: hypothetical protein VIB78_13960 [Acidimicrobiia bacterium]